MRPRRFCKGVLAIAFFAANAAFAVTVREADAVRWLCADDGTRLVGVGTFVYQPADWRVTTTCTSSADRVTFYFRAMGGKEAPKGWMLNLPLGSDAEKVQKVEKLGRWRRFDADVQAEPMEHPLGKFKTIRSPHGNVLMRLTGNENWTSEKRDHVAFAKQADGTWQGSVTFYPMRPDEPPHVCVARVSGLPFAIRLATDRRNNLFETNAANVQLALAETAGKAVSDVPFSVVVRDWDGREVFARRDKLTFRAYAHKSINLPLALPGRGLYFAEASLGDAFTRTTLAVIPPFAFKHRDTSVLGLNLRCGRVFKDEREAEYALAARLGMAYLRSGDNRLARRFGMEAGYTAQMPKFDYVAGDAKCDGAVKAWLDAIARYEANVFEFGNEIAHFADTPTRHRLYDRYAGWLDAIRAARTARGMRFQILYGTSAKRPELVRLIAEKGIFDRLDALVVHPGRLNWTSDLLGSGWRYHGIVHDSRLLYEAVGQKGKPIYLTETYTKTRPNDAHSDSLRQSAENAVLNVVIAMAEGCRRLCAYQLHEGVSFDENGINLKDTEYHYGILNRDNSLKPSAMAYETAAEELDGARFVRWIDKEGTKLKGCLFDTPKGPLAVLWDRTEGYDLRKQGPRARKKDAPFFHFEPWLANWRVATPYVFPVAKATAIGVTVRDAIGRVTRLPAAGNVRLSLTGAPVFVRGLDFSAGRASSSCYTPKPDEDALPAADAYERNAKLY